MGAELDCIVEYENPLDSATDDETLVLNDVENEGLESCCENENEKLRIWL
jgi:hypothetical protein